MRKCLTVRGLGLIGLGLATSAIAAPAPWGYRGSLGPRHWASIEGSYALCDRGLAQSPVNLNWTPAKGVETLSFQYSEGPIRAINTGLGIKYRFNAANTLLLSGQSYTLKSVLVHVPSEHKLGGNQYPVEFQLFHKSAAGKKVMVSVFGVLGKSHRGLAPVIAGVPEKSQKGITYSGKFFNPANFLPSNMNHYSYEGSFTVPPCVEGVTWKVLNTPIELSPDQMEELRNRYSGNVRPVQSLGRRNPVVYLGGK